SGFQRLKKNPDLGVPRSGLIWHARPTTCIMHAMHRLMHTLDRFFHLTQRGSSLRVEVIGGITTFITMAYIIVVNPAILAFAGIPVGPSTVATVLVAAGGTLLMGLYANRPIAVAPYM